MPIQRPIPVPTGQPRRDEAFRRRQQATTVAFYRPQPLSEGRDPPTENNGEERMFSTSYSMNFTKGLPRDAFGIVFPAAYEAFVDAINAPNAQTAGGTDVFDSTVPLGPPDAPKSNNPFGLPVPPDQRDFRCTIRGSSERIAVRNWESPRAGHVYDLEGPDADAVCMPPAPKVASDEMAVEMAEVYALALLRDVPFSVIEAAGSAGHHYNAETAAADIADMAWFSEATPKTGGEAKRCMARGLEQAQAGETAAQRKARAKRNAARLFRGSAPGAQAGPYISQFMLVGSVGRAGEKRTNTGTTFPGLNPSFEADDGLINYGAQVIDQRIVVAQEGIDYMSEWREWLDVQNGADVKNTDVFESRRRFITTPRDLATYVHFDALYQAYLNACLAMQGLGIPYDRGFPSGSFPDHATRGSFATFGDPHILALLTEVSTRALRAVRRQKFGYHRRCRPETIGAMLSLAASTDPAATAYSWDARVAFETMEGKLPSRLLKAVARRNTDLAKYAERRKRRVVCPDRNPDWLSNSANYLLPMAFPEGSPMHPSYGAGHATVAGACVTVLKAFFEMYAEDGETLAPYPLALYRAHPGDSSTRRGQVLDPVTSSDEITISGELNKLAANISIGRNMAGVHFYSDYYDSLRMGERIAVGILQEQMLNYAERVTMTFPGFDGERITIASVNGGGTSIDDPVVLIDDAPAPRDWWLCELSEDNRFLV